MRDGKHIIIAGTGASGMLSAIELARQARGPLTLIMVEKNQGVRGGGLTFGMETSGDEHRINIKTKYLSAFPEKPQDFLDWLQDPTTDRSKWPEAHRDLQFDERTGVPRKLYSLYLTQRLNEVTAATEGRVTIQPITGQVVSIEESANCVTAHLHDSRSIRASQAVLATGYLATRQDSFMTDPLTQDKRFILDQWAPDARARLQQLDPAANVLVLGTGLSAYDAIVSLRAKGHKGKITLMSRGGHIYPYNPGEWTTPKVKPLERPAFLDHVTDRTSLIEGLRTEFTSMREKGYTAKHIIDSWEKYVPEVVEKIGDPAVIASLLKEYSSLIASQRISVNEDIWKTIDAAMQDGQVEFVKGNVHSIVPTKEGLWTSYTPSGSDERESLKFDCVINAIGQEIDLNKANDPLWDDMLHKGKAQPHYTNLGVQCDALGRPMGVEGKPSERIYMVCIMRTGESTVGGRGLGVGAVNIPTIKAQAHEIAEHILSRRIDMTAPASRVDTLKPVKASYAGRC